MNIEALIENLEALDDSLKTTIIRESENFDDFKGFYINRIRKELEDKGETLSVAQERQIEKLYRTATGEGLDRYGKGVQDVVDGYGFVNRVAMLGMATVSSLTEVFINISILLGFYLTKHIHHTGIGILLLLLCGLNSLGNSCK